MQASERRNDVDEHPSGAIHAKRSKTVRYVIVIVGLLLAVGTLVGVKAAQIGKLISFGKQMEAAGPPPEAVASVLAEEQTWEATLQSVGSVASGKGVSISNDAPGVVSKIHFESGKSVKQGDILVELDTSVERAQLASAMARRDLATTTAGRARALGAQGAISQAQVDQEESQQKTSTTDVEAIRAQIERKIIRAPFAGKLGIRGVNLGQYLNPGTTITSLESVEAVHVDFTLPQQKVSEVGVGMPLRITIEGVPGPVIEGKVGAVDPALDAVTRNVKLRGDVDKSDPRLRSGMFVNVAVLLPQTNKLVSVPVTAVVRAPYGNSVFVVEEKKPGTPGMDKTPDGKPVLVARQQFVRTGESRGDFVSITEGLKAGQRVVTAGAFKLRNGAPVFLDDKQQPKPSLDPKPENR